MHNIERQKLQAFPFHLVDPSPWPILTSFSLLTMAIGAVLYFHGFNNGGYMLLLGFCLTASGMTLWFKDVIYEGTELKLHQKGFNSTNNYEIVLNCKLKHFPFHKHIQNVFKNNPTYIGLPMVSKRYQSSSNLNSDKEINIEK
jgi:Cytochrome c oxidase subunit III/LAGLIDADG endonuclease